MKISSIEPKSFGGLFATGLMLACAAWEIAAQAPGLPLDVQRAIAKTYVSPDMETRYLDGAVDLNGDGKSEIIVHVVGGGACGTGGCPTLVFTPTAAGYRLVTTISVTNPPIRAAAASTNGWRNLIVHVRGGGAQSRDAELLFDGKSYPANPTVGGARVKTAAPGGDVVIKEFTAFDQAKPFPRDASNAPAATAPTDPSFDCAKATLVAEKVVCADAPLSALDRAVADAYSKAMKNWDEANRVTQRTTQRQWLETRNGCVRPGAVNAVVIECLQGIYRRRLIEIQITGGLLTAPTAVEYRCDNSTERFAAAFYNQTDPQSAALTWGNRQVVAIAARSASGARYTATDVEFWEHQGEAAVKWSGTSLTCKPVK